MDACTGLKLTKQRIPSTSICTCLDKVSIHISAYFFIKIVFSARHMTSPFMLQANILFLGWIYFDKKSGNTKQLWYVYKNGNKVAFENCEYSNYWLGGNGTWALNSHDKKVWWKTNWKELAISIILIYWFWISRVQLRKK